MLKIYKSGIVELLEENFTVDTHSIDWMEQLPAYGEGDAADTDGSEPPPTDFAADEMVTMLKSAEKRAEELMQEARDRAAAEAQEILNSARQQAVQEMELMRAKTYEEAYNNGIADGIKAKTRQVEAVIAKLEDTVVRIEGEMSGFIAQYEGDLKWTVLEVAGKVLDKIIERDDLEMLAMVKAAVDTVKNSQWIEVHLSDEAVYLIDRLEREMAPMKYLTVIPEDLPPGSCIVDIPSGRVDASIQTQLDNLKEYFASHGADL